MTEYKKGDKVVVEIDEADAFELNNERDMEPDYEQVLGKLEDFQPAEEKIRFTVEEKKEFDKIRRNYSTIQEAFKNITQEKYPTMYKRLFWNDNAEEDKQYQVEFVHALDNPELIEVIEFEKHLVELNNGTRLQKDDDDGAYFISRDALCGFTLDEVKEAEKQLGIQGLQDKWHEVAKENRK